MTAEFPAPNLFIQYTDYKTSIKYYTTTIKVFYMAYQLCVIKKLKRKLHVIVKLSEDREM